MIADLQFEHFNTLVLPLLPVGLVEVPSVYPLTIEPVFPLCLVAPIGRAVVIHKHRQRKVTKP